MIRLEKVEVQENIGIYEIKLDDNQTLTVSDSELAILKNLIDTRLEENDKELNESYMELLINRYNGSELYLKVNQQELDQLVKHPNLKSVSEIYNGLGLEFVGGRKIKVELANGVKLK